MHVLRMNADFRLNAVRRMLSIEKDRLYAHAINSIINRRVEMAGFDSEEFSAHGLWSYYLTEVTNRDIPLR